MTVYKADKMGIIEGANLAVFDDGQLVTFGALPDCINFLKAHCLMGYELEGFSVWVKDGFPYLRMNITFL